MKDTHARESDDFRDLRNHLDFIEANAPWAWDWNNTILTEDTDWFKYPHAKVEQDNHQDSRASDVRGIANIESKIAQHKDDITQLKAQINGHYLNKVRLKTMAAARNKTSEKLRMQIKDLNTNSQMTGHEENLTFMYHRIHGMSKEYEPRPDRIGKLINRLFIDLEGANPKLKKLVKVSNRSKERSNAICHAVLISESPNEELAIDYSMAKMTILHYLSKQGSRTYVLNPKEGEAQTKYG